MKSRLPSLWLVTLLSFMPIAAFSQTPRATKGAATHLLITEVVVTPTSSEYIEIHNPGDSEVTLTNYYLSDDADYALTPGMTGDGPMPAIGDSDFIAQFPNGATIGAGETQVIAFSGTGFNTDFAMTADYEILGDDAGTPDMIDTAIGATAGLTNSGENVVLFYWDGASDLVQDVDMLNVGTPSASNAIGDKTGVSVDGPDGDTNASMYLADAMTMPQQATDPGFGFSAKRISNTETDEVQSGGNGLLGHDETTENILVTWDDNSSAPDPGVYNPSATVALFINELDADTAGTDTLEFIELFGTPNTSLDGYVIVLYNGSNDQSYAAFDLDGHSLDADGFFVLGNAAVANVDFVIPDNTLQNGADAAALYEGDDTDFPDNTPVTSSNLIDALVYDTNDADDTGLIDELLGPGSTQINEDENGSKDTQSIARVPDGGTVLSPDEFVVQDPTPGATNVPAAPEIFINELDADTAGTDTLEFIELFGAANASLDGLVIVLYNGSNDQSYAAFDLDGHSLDGDGFFVLGSAAVANVDFVIPDNTLQNGADAAALYEGDDTDFPDNTPVTNTNLIDALVYDTNDGDDTGLIDVLLGPGSTQINEDENGSKDTQSIARVPDGGTLLSPDEFVVQNPTPGATNVGSPVVTIAEVQGNGFTSPLVGSDVTVEDTVVTAVAPDGFFIQDPTPDADPDTSDGVFVFTDNAPTVAVGDAVRVTGTVEEFFDFTRISGTPSVDILSSGNNVPAPIVFDGGLPSPNQPVDDLQFERLEGVLVSIADGMVTGPNQAFGSDPIAEFHINAGGTRTYREPGIEYPGQGGLPIWDGNPEVFECDPNRLGLANVRAVAGQTFSATGVIGYEFGEYELFPSVLNLGAEPTAASVRDRETGEVTVGSLNLFRLFDEEGDYAVRLEKFSRYIRQQLKSPDFLAVQEANGLQELQDLAARISSDDPSVTYTAGLLVGNNFSDIFNGYLVRDGVTVNGSALIQADETFDFDNNTYTLHDRPPLAVDLTFNTPTRGASGFDLTVIIIHNRSLSDIDDPGNGDFVRFKRDRQATRISEEIQSRQSGDPNLKMLLVGDFNAFQFTDGYVDVLGQITGDLDPLGALVPGTDLVDPDLINLINTLPESERYSFIARGNAQVLDHALITQNMDCYVTGTAFGRGNADFARNYSEDASTPLRASDHDGLVVFLDPVPAQIIVSETDLTTSEGGPDQTFDVVLSKEPAADVTVPITGLDTTEGSLSTTMLTFTSANWDTPQTVTLTPIDDAQLDGDIMYTLTVGPSTSGDGCFDGLASQDITVLNIDASSAGGTTISADPGQAVIINGPPNTTVGLYVYNPATGEWEFLENVTIGANGIGIASTVAQSDTTYGVGGIDGSLDPSTIIVMTVPTLGTWALILFMIILAGAAMVINRKPNQIQS